LDVRDEDSMSVSAGEDVVCVGHIDKRAAFDAVLIAHIKTDVVLDVELPEAFVLL
jgi:hypothetical protein